MPATTTTGYKLIPASTPLINWTALWHIVLISVAAGAGLAIAFGILLLGTEYVQAGRTAAVKSTGWLLGIAATVFCLAAIGIGIYVMVNPTASKPLRVVPTAAAPG